MRRLLPTFLLALVALLSSCGADPTPEHTEILNVELHGDLPEADRARLVGVIRADPARVAFEDGETAVEVEVVGARLADAAEGGAPTAIRPDVLEASPSHIRTLRVTVAEAGGRQVTASLTGSPVNAGSEALPVHTRTLLVTRTRAGIFGTSSEQMSIEVTPTGAARR